MAGDENARRVAAMAGDVLIHPGQHAPHLRAHGFDGGVGDQVKVGHHHRHAGGHQRGGDKTAVFFGERTPIAAVQKDHDRRTRLGCRVNVEFVVGARAVGH